MYKMMGCNIFINLKLMIIYYYFFKQMKRNSTAKTETVQAHLPATSGLVGKEHNLQGLKLMIILTTCCGSATTTNLLEKDHIDIEKDCLSALSRKRST